MRCFQRCGGMGFVSLWQSTFSWAAVTSDGMWSKALICMIFVLFEYLCAHFGWWPMYICLCDLSLYDVCVEVRCYETCPCEVLNWVSI